MAQTMLAAMLIMTAAAWAYSIAASLVRVRSLIIEREPSSAWNQSLSRQQKALAGVVPK